jgi:hypothetical protein
MLRTPAAAAEAERATVAARLAVEQAAAARRTSEPLLAVQTPRPLFGSRNQSTMESPDEAAPVGGRGV